MSVRIDQGGHRGAQLTLITSMVIFSAGCAPNVQIGETCRLGEVAAISDTLYFGAATPGGRVTEPDWDGFLTASGYRGGATHWKARGLWTSRQGRMIEEDVYLLQIVYRESEGMENRITGLISQYRKRFRQESVLRVRAPACVSGLGLD